MRNISLGGLLAYEYREEQADSRLVALLKLIANFFLIYFPVFFCLRAVQRILSDNPYYPIKDEIILTTTRVIFTRSKRSGSQICLKLWQRAANEVCDDRLIVRDDDYLLEGLKFNRKLAPHVYLGVASVIIHDDKKIQRGRLIKYPRKEQLFMGENGERNALVMKTLKEERRLDRQLAKGKVDVNFLAREIARMQRQINNTHEVETYHTDDYAKKIAEKLEMNIGFFNEAVNRLFPHGRNKYEDICGHLNQACQKFADLFEARYREGHIKRRHGDLKLTNLWVRPHMFPLLRPKLLALDCVDFNPELCHIDELSDVAMLAIDLERFYPHDKNVADRFLREYLRNMQEDQEQVAALLEYYMTEKAIVCAYVSILFDTHNSDLGKQYLQIAVAHGQRLGKLLSTSGKQAGKVAEPVHAN